MSSNVLFDLILSRLYVSFGAETAQRIAVSLSALLFFWGAFAFVSAASRVRPWFLAPCLLMLTYGWTFHIGFFNFYLASGLSLWALALLLRGGFFRALAAAILLVVAYAAHPMPPAWAAGVIAYYWIGGKLPVLFRFGLLGLGLAAIAFIRYWIYSRYPASSTFHQYLESTAIDQVWVFGLKYWALALVLALLWGFLLLRLSHLRGAFALASDSLFQLCALMAVAIIFLPSTIEFPQYPIALSFITERATLLYGALICALLAGSDPPAWLRVAFTPLALIYFSLIFVDTAAINKVEQQMETLTAGLSLNDRVISSFEDPVSRVQLWAHNLDRACLGRCVSYANYEPFTLAFRVRARRRNPLVVADPLDYAALAAGGYVVQPGDLPFYQITLCSGRTSEMCLHRLSAGEVTRHETLSVTPAWWKAAE
jgi:hypothetical protein